MPVCVAMRGDLRLHQLHPLLQREQRPLAGVDRDADHQLVQQPRGAGDDVEMAVGDRIERAGIQPDAQLFAGLVIVAVLVSARRTRRSSLVSRASSITGNTLVTCSPRRRGTASRPSPGGR